MLAQCQRPAPHWPKPEAIAVFPEFILECKPALQHAFGDERHQVFDGPFCGNVCYHALIPEGHRAMPLVGGQPDAMLFVCCSSCTLDGLSTGLAFNQHCRLHGGRSVLYHQSIVCLVKSAQLTERERERTREIYYVHSASLAYEDGIMFMSEPSAARQ